jgi:hypothetical protein
MWERRARLEAEADRPIRIETALSIVMAGLVPAIHVLMSTFAPLKPWMPATWAGMTSLAAVR